MFSLHVQVERIIPDEILPSVSDVCLDEPGT